jgi:hypothetical protein
MRRSAKVLYQQESQARHSHRTSKTSQYGSERAALLHVMVDTVIELLGLGQAIDRCLAGLNLETVTEAEKASLQAASN